MKYINKKSLRISEGKTMPDDFWNYLVNPIVGYYVPKVNEFKKDKELKYIKPNNGL
jgi:hypothetical protein